MKGTHRGREDASFGGRALSRRDFLKGLAAVGVAAGGGFLMPRRDAFASVDVRRLDPVERLAYEKLKSFTDWIKRERVRGYLGEVGWPSDARHGVKDGRKWNALADKWYGWADDANLWVTAHDINERQIYGGYYMSIYTAVGERGRRALSVAKPQATVLEAHPANANYKRGINDETGSSIERHDFHNKNLGEFGKSGPNNYWYAGVANDGPDGGNSFEYLRERNIRVVRMGFRWERFMPGGPGTNLSEVELQRYRAAVDAAGRAGLEVILDAHNYGGYWFEENGKAVERLINGDRVSIENFVDLWKQLSDRFKNDPAVIGYDLMNEPDVAQGRFASEDLAWQAATRMAVAAIRANGDGKTIIAPTYFGKGDPDEKLPKAWIDDPAEDILYTAHQYFDTARGGDTGGGRYSNTYANEAAHLRDRYPDSKPVAKDKRKRAARARRRQRRRNR
ncbi:MAG: glycoside hydrolase family 5 protein [Rubrobacteraceae bacterium]